MGAPEKISTSNSNSSQRVKVYRLNGDEKWDDQGTGHVTVDYLERSEEMGLFVVDEEDNETLLVHRISSDDIYRKQEDTIISWKDPEYSSELALSFQETTGCSYIWDNIRNAQRNLHFSTPSSETYHGANSELRELPAVELSTLSSILKIVIGSNTNKLYVTELILHDHIFFRKLIDLFRVCEDLENKDGLHMIYKIVRGIILLNSPQIFEKILGDELIIMDIIGCLEYNPNMPRVHHRNFLKEHVVFKEAIPIKDPLALSKIHQIYRINYLKDIVLPRVLDEATVASLNSIIHSNNGMVVALLKNDSNFLKELFASLKSPTTSPGSKTDLVIFLQEFCNLIKSFQMVQQIRLFRDLVNEGIFDVITKILQSRDKKLVLTGTDILVLLVNVDSTMLRSYVSQQEGFPLLGLLVEGMLSDFGDDMHCQFLEIIRSLLDSYSAGQLQKDAIIEIFYQRHFDQLINVITSSCPSNVAAQALHKSTSSNGNFGSQTSAKPETLLNICDLLCFCLMHHPYRIKCNFLLNGVIDKVLNLTRRREKYLVVAAVRFIRTLISLKDEHLMNHIVKNNVFKPIIDVFVGNGNRYNLLNSSALELFEYIRKEDLKILVKYLVETFWEKLVKFDYLPSIQSLKVRYEQAMEQAVDLYSSKPSETRRRIDERSLEKEEEDYFNEDSDEDTTSASMAQTMRIRAQPGLSNGSSESYPSSSPRPGGLVDYEDEEDYKPPPKKRPEKSEDDKKTIEFSFKRKVLALKEQPNVVKRHRLGAKNPKSKDNVFIFKESTSAKSVRDSQITKTSANEKCHADKESTSQNEESEADKSLMHVVQVINAHSNENSGSKSSPETLVNGS